MSYELDYFRILQGFTVTEEILLAPVRPRAIPMGNADISPHVLAEAAELKRHPVLSQSQDQHKQRAAIFLYLPPNQGYIYTIQADQQVFKHCLVLQSEGDFFF